MKLSMRQYWQANLVCPSCKGRLEIHEPLMRCIVCGCTYSIASGVPCFVSNTLTEHQKSELRFVKDNLNGLRQKIHSIRHENPEDLRENKSWSWSLNWINDQTVTKQARIICIGGSIGDDLPLVQSDYKFNVDHLAHEYIKILPEMSDTNISHIAGLAEALPFPDGYADIVYSRNSLDHVCNPIKTLLEINRILSARGRFFLSVYYNSNFIDPGETTTIDDDFINNHLKNIFNVEWMDVKSPEAERISQPPVYSLPSNRELGWLYAVCRKKYVFSPYEGNELASYQDLISSFHSAVYYDQHGNLTEASRFYEKVIDRTPFLKSDEMRILYSKIRYYSLKDYSKLKELFEEFVLNNRDPFWWKIWISSSSIDNETLGNEMRKCFSDPQVCEYLNQAIQTVSVSKHMKETMSQYPSLYATIERLKSFANSWIGRMYRL